MKYLSAILLAVSLVLAPIVLKKSRPKTYELVNVVDGELIDVKLGPVDKLGSKKPIKPQKFSKTLVLEKTNMVVLRGPVTEDSVARTQMKLLKVSRRISKNTPIYLVLDTPGGSVFDGLDLIDFADALPQKVYTVTLFAASMGFNIAQALDTRYIARNGTLMSHRASLSGLEGQIKGELEERYGMIRRAVDFMDYTAAKRMGISVKEYEKLIINEYWVHGYDSVREKAADEQVRLRCGSSLDGTEDVEFQTFLGTVKAQFSKCPLIRAPISADFDAISSKDPRDLKKVKEIFNMAFKNRVKFVTEYITNNKYREIFR